MPIRVTTNICNRCRRSFMGSGSLCPACKGPDTRESSHRRGYDREWRRVRARVLESHNIPKEQWPLYAVDHNPPYDKDIEPDHTRYVLIPRLMADHNRKTAREDTTRDHKGRFKGKKR